MSGKALGWVFDHSPYSGDIFATHLALADVSNDLNNNEIWMSQARLAKKSRNGRQTVNRHIARMIKEGLLELIEGKQDGETKSINRYRMLFPEGVALHDSFKSEGVALAQPKVSLSHTEGVALATSRPLIELKELKEEQHKDSSSPEIEVQTDAMRLCSLLADLIEANGSKRPTVTKAWEVTMDRLMRIDQRSSEQVEAAIRWSQQHDFWSGNVLSPTKLRKHYDAMRIQARRESGSKTGSKGLATLAALDNQLSRKELS